MRAAFYTFGCKLNQCETEAIASSFKNNGISSIHISQNAEIYVINTCTVTSKSEQKARKLIRKLSRLHPKSMIIVTGCYAQLNGDELRVLGDNIKVLTQDNKDLLLDFPGFIREERTSGEALTGIYDRLILKAGHTTEAKRYPEAMFRFQTISYNFHSRAFLKIQDGCDYRCAYCRIPLARGHSISLDPQSIIHRIHELEESGYREIVLTGVNISAYRCGEIGLPSLLSLILAESHTARFRLSSLEPEMIDQELVSVLQNQRICPHFHIPIQSGSDKILVKMQRRYKAERVTHAVRLLKVAKPEAFIAADIIVGFPGETEEDFILTKTLIETLKISKLHVFPFSPRPGTKAADMKARVPERIRDLRVHEFIALSNELYKDYMRTRKEKELDVILENRTVETPYWDGLSENYLKVRIYGTMPAAARQGDLVRVIIDTYGEPCTGHAADTSIPYCFL